MITVYQPEPNYVHKYLRNQNYIDDSNSDELMKLMMMKKIMTKDIVFK